MNLVSPPHVLMESRKSYSIVFNMLGIQIENIQIGIDGQQKEIRVAAMKQTTEKKRNFFWIFGIPTDAVIGQVSTRFRAGVLEILIPKQEAICSA